MEYQLFDRKGYRAGWLDPKLEHGSVHEDVTRQVLAAMAQDSHNALEPYENNT